MTPIKDVDISSPAFKANPYPFYAQLRDQAPVHRVILGDKRPAWLVSRYNDVVTVLEEEGVAKFEVSWKELLDTISREMAAHSS